MGVTALSIMFSVFRCFFQSLIDIVQKIQAVAHGSKPELMVRRDGTVSSGQGGVHEVEKPFDAMNNIVANLLLNMTRYGSVVSSIARGSAVQRTNEYSPFLKFSQVI